MKFCSQCGSPALELRVPSGDTLPRYVCSSCGTIHYQNPKVVVGCLPVWGEQVLLCKRAIEPRHGLWTLPAGFLENGETIFAGAARETAEEAHARVVVGPLYTMISLPYINQVYVMFRARLVDRVRSWPREHRGAAVRGERRAVERDRLSHDHADAAQLFSRP